MAISKETELFIFQRDNYTCQGCKKQFPHKYEIPAEQRNARTNFLIVDHMNDRSENIENLQTLCFKCNGSKAGKSANSFRLFSALKRLGPCVVYYPSLARLIGLKESIFLCQLIYWTPRGRNDKGDGWIYKSVEEMEEETGLSYKEQLRLRKSLSMMGLLEEKYERDSHNLYFKVNADELDSRGEHMTFGHMPKSDQAPAQREGGTLPKVISYKEAEITQENTQTKTVSAPSADDFKNGITIPMAAMALCDDLRFSGTLMLNIAHSTIESVIRHNPEKTPYDVRVELAALYQEYQASGLHVKASAKNWLSEGLYNRPEKWRKPAASNGNGRQPAKKSETPSVVPFLEEIRKKREAAQAEQDAQDDKK